MKHRVLILAAAACMALVASPPVSAAALTDFAENKLLDALVRGQAVTLPTTWHLALSTDTCSDSTAGAEPAGAGYSRASVTASMANWAGTQSAGSTTASTGTGGTTSNNATVTWPESSASWGTLQSVQWYDAASGGNRWICINLTAPFAVAAGGVTVRFPAGALSFQIDN